MNCPKCSFDFGNMQPNYCPNCGKKIIIMPKVLMKKFRRIDYFRFLDKERFAKFWDSCLSLNADDAYNWFQTQQPDVFVYVISTKYKYRLTDCKGELIRIEDREDKRTSVERLKDIINSKDYNEVLACPKKTELDYKYSPFKYGDNWWWTKEECQNAIEGAIREVKSECQD